MERRRIEHRAGLAFDRLRLTPFFGSGGINRVTLSVSKGGATHRHKMPARTPAVHIHHSSRGFDARKPRRPTLVW